MEHLTKTVLLRQGERAITTPADLDIWEYNLHQRWALRPLLLHEERIRSLLESSVHYIDSKSQNPVEELVKLGGVKIILGTGPGGKVISSVLGGLAVNGKLITIGASDEPLEVSPNFLLSGRRSIIGWNSETSIDSQDTLSFSVLTGVRSVNEVFPIERAAEAYELMMSSKVRFRAVLTTGQ
jgi:D-arabinose 1-dehydrogenase-like Zn-dependent alcohol dehydrogenase